MTIMKIAKKILRATIEWSVLVGMTMLVCSVDGFWPTLGLMWVMCFIASATAMLTALLSGKVTLAQPESVKPTDVEIADYDAKWRRDDCDDCVDFILSDG